MRKQALPTYKERERLVGRKGMEAHRRRIVDMRDFRRQLGEVPAWEGPTVTKALATLANPAVVADTAPEKLHQAHLNVAGVRSTLERGVDATRKQARIAKFKRALLKRNLPMMLGLGGLAAAGGGLYMLNTKLRPQAPELAVRPLKRSKVMDAVYRVLNIEPNLPEYEAVPPGEKPAANPLTLAWAEGFEKYCYDNGVDAEELVTILAGEEKRAIPGVTSTAATLQRAMEKLWQKLIVRPFIFNPRKLGMRVNAEGGVMPLRRP